MALLQDAPEFLHRLFPAAGAELMRLDVQAAEEAGLLHADFCTIRDLLELSDYQADETLHAWLIVLLMALDEGSLCVEVSEPTLVRRLTDLVGDESARSWAQRMVAAIAPQAFPALIGSDVSQDRPVVLYSHEGRRFLYFQKYLAHEQALLTVLRQRLSAAATATAPDNLREVLDEVLYHRPPRVQGKPLELNLYQRRALGLALLRNFAIVSGGPGTGKTSIVFSLLRCLVRCGIATERIALAAPTGRAAQRLSDAVRAGLERLDERTTGPDAPLNDLTAHTLHQLLGYQPSRGTFRHHVENPLPADVVIVDEVSMVGLVLMTRLLEATAPQTRLILLGDKDQLPAVEAGALLAHLVPGDGRPRYSEELSCRLAAVLPGCDPFPFDPPHPLRDSLVVLEENYRSQQEIQAAAAAINCRDVDIVDRLPRFAPLRGEAPPSIGPAPSTTFADLAQRGGCWWLDTTDGSVADWRRVLTHWAEHQFGAAAAGEDSYADLVARCRVGGLDETSGESRQHLGRLFALLDRCRILTLLREGPWGCAAVNRFLEQTLRPRLDGRGSGTLFAGAPVLITRNDHARQLYNGDVGVALRGAGGLRVVFARQGGFLSIPVDALPAHELAFALTVHKSQGSEYDQVLLVLPPAGGRRLLTKELLYTGITRARHLALVCGTRQALTTAILRKVEREAALLDFAMLSESGEKRLRTSRGRRGR